jgi:hypothetical protein
MFSVSVVCLFLLICTACCQIYSINTISSSSSDYDVGYETYAKAFDYRSHQLTYCTIVSIVNNSPLKLDLKGFYTTPGFAASTIGPGTVGSYGWGFTDTYFDCLKFAFSDMIVSGTAYYTICFSGSTTSYSYQIWRVDANMNSFPPTGSSPIDSSSTSLILGTTITVPTTPPHTLAFTGFMRNLDTTGSLMFSLTFTDTTSNPL